MKSRLHRFALVVSFILVVCGVADAGETPKTLSDWIAFIKKDAKLSALQSALGKPDAIDETQTMFVKYTYYTWYGKMDVGTTTTERLRVETVKYRDKDVVVIGVFDPISSKMVPFPWSTDAAWESH